MKNATERFNKKFLEIEHFKKHSQIMPFVGKSWGKTGKLLVIGESHYLDDNDENASKRKNKWIWKNWYDITSEDLTETQLGWTSTAKMINEAITKDEYHLGWGIWRNIKNAILKTGFNPDANNTSKILRFIAFMNFFQRPALETGETISHDEKDIRIANETLNEVVGIIKPDYLFFVSSKAWEEFDNEVLLNEKVIGHSCHPTSPWWNIESAKYTKPNRKEKIKGEESFQYFVKKNKIFE